MEDRKIVTDEQIIKCLELCTGKGGVINCEPCLVGKEFGWQGCEKNLMLQCRGLINRQKAEIEKKNTEIDILIEKKDSLQDENSELMAEVERLKEAIISKSLTPTAYKVMQENYEKHFHIINGLNAEIERLKDENLKLFHKMHLMRAEAIRDVAVKLPELIPNITGETTLEAVERAIKHLVKEMAGEEK